MGRRKSEEKRLALLDAAAAVVAERGLGAPTSQIARKAGLADGTLFLYFATKDDLLNDLFVYLKRHLHTCIIDGHDPDSDLLERNRRVWNNYIRWGVEHNDKSRALVQLSASNQIRPEVWASVNEIYFDLGEIDVNYKSAFPADMIAFSDAVSAALAQVTVDFASRHDGANGIYTEAGFNLMMKIVG